MPDFYFELRRAQAEALVSALTEIDRATEELGAITGRDAGPLEAYRLDDARTALVVMGSAAGTAKDAVDELRAEGVHVGLLKVRSFRPFALERVRDALWRVPEVAVLDRADSPGGAPPLYAEVAAALYGAGPRLTGHVFGLGGRDLHPRDVREVLFGQAGPYVGVRSEQ
jgi:pyruvate ferredoxin oxidoreductase alpha subunit